MSFAKLWRASASAGRRKRAPEAHTFTLSQECCCERRSRRSDSNSFVLFWVYCAQLLYSVCERGLQQPWMPRASIFWTCCDSRAFRESHSSSPNVPWLHCQT